MACRCGPRANKTTSAPARASRAPMYPPIAPAPAMTILTTPSASTGGTRRHAESCRSPSENSLRPLVVGESLPAEREQIRLRDDGPHDHDRLYFLAPGRMRDAEGHGLGDRRVRE